LSEKKFTNEMIGEALREAGTLVLVFTPLYELFEPKPPKWGIVLSVIEVCPDFCVNDQELFLGMGCRGREQFPFPGPSL
jgi:hypothetical protein